MAFGNATKGYVKKHSGGGGGGGTTNYSELSNKPQINGVTLDGDKTSEDLGISGGGGGADFSSATLWKTNPATSDRLPLSSVTQYVAVVIASVYTGGVVSEYDIHIIPKFLLDTIADNSNMYIYYNLDSSKYISLQMLSNNIAFPINQTEKRVYVYYK